MTGTNLEIKGDAPTKVMLKSKNNIMDIVWLFMLKPGQNIKVANDYLPFEDSLRLMKSDMHLENMVLDIKSLDYHMIPSDKILSKEEYAKKRNSGEKFQPIFRLNSSIDLKNNNLVKFVKLEIPQPLPSELLNAVLRQEIFKRGQVSGDMTISGQMNMDRVIIPSQMLFVKQAVVKSSNNLIHLDADGGYRHEKFNFSGDIINQIKFPVIVKDVNLSLENIDTFKLLNSFNNQTLSDNTIKTDDGIVSVQNGNDFDIRNIIIEKGVFHLNKGTYKDIEFANLEADLTLDKNGVVNIKSNRFEFAQGHSSLMANFDLPNKKYNVKLCQISINFE